MVEKPRKYFVIDSDTLGYASYSNDPKCKKCRDFIKSVLDICFGAVTGGMIQEEWNRHLSPYSRKWKVYMNSKKKIEDKNFNYAGIEKIFNDIKNSDIFSERQLDALEKDKPLISAALVNDSIIVSCDNTVRKLYAKAAQEITKVGTQIGDIIWINPAIDDERPIDWLESGAPASDDKKLINFPLS